MAGISKLKTDNYSDYNEFRLWCLRNAPSLLMDFYEPFLSYSEWENIQEKQWKHFNNVPSRYDVKIIIAHFLSNTDKYLYWHCPLDFIREYLETQCGYKKANWFVRLFWRN